jgi:hypothetical protein
MKTGSQFPDEGRDGSRIVGLFTIKLFNILVTLRETGCDDARWIE